MHFQKIALSLAALAPLARANFHLYWASQQATISFGGDNEPTEGWSVFESDPDCGEVRDARFWTNKGDLSGKGSSSRGVRCEGGCGPGGSPSDIDELEMHFNNDPYHHFTIYKDRDYKMYGVDGNVYGQCHPYPDNSYDCLGVDILRGRRKFECITEFSAEDINQ